MTRTFGLDPLTPKSPFFDPSLLRTPDHNQQTDGNLVSPTRRGGRRQIIHINLGHREPRLQPGGLPPEHGRPMISSAVRRAKWEMLTASLTSIRRGARRCAKASRVHYLDRTRERPWEASAHTGRRVRAEQGAVPARHHHPRVVNSRRTRYIHPPTPSNECVQVTGACESRFSIACQRLLYLRPISLLLGLQDLGKFALPIGLNRVISLAEKTKTWCMTP